jgi:hypothetical protein
MLWVSSNRLLWVFPLWQPSQRATDAPPLASRRSFSCRIIFRLLVEALHALESLLERQAKQERAEGLEGRFP